MNISKLSTKTQREILLKVANYIASFAEDYDDTTIESFLETLVEFYLDPLSAEDYFGTEGWEVFFNVYD